MPVGAPREMRRGVDTHINTSKLRIRQRKHNKLQECKRCPAWGVGEDVTSSKSGLTLGYNSHLGPYPHALSR